MKVLRAALFFCLVLPASLMGIAGCCGPGGGGATVESRNITTTKTLGEQLIDLQKAYESGAITEDQYHDLKKKAIKEYGGN
ncbi:MAG TPA: hypothetical protein PLI53_10055 [Geobacteraceae bacterium]|nr:hypothetical protein [Geobacteraceae bacterium]